MHCLRIFAVVLFSFIVWPAYGGQTLTLDENVKTPADDSKRLTDLLAKVPKGSTLVFVGPHVYKITRAMKFPADLALVFQNGAVLEPAEGVSLELNGPIQAGVQTIFSLSGKVRLGDSAAAMVYPQWWGAWNDGTHEAQTTRALQAAFDSGHKVFIPLGTYLTRELKVQTDGLIVEGANREKSILKLAQSKGILLNLQATFAKISDLTLEGTAQNKDVNQVGINMNHATRDKIENVRITGFAYGIEIEDFGGNNIDHCYIFRNQRAGIYLAGGAHGVSITNGTEIAGSPFGIMLGLFRESPWNVDYSFAGVTGEMVSVHGVIIEGIHAVDGPHCKKCIGGIGIFSGIGQKGINVTDTYFEDMNAAIQLGNQFENDGVGKHSTGVLNTEFSNNFLSNIKSAVKVGRVNFGQIINNHCAKVENLFDTSEAGLFTNMRVEGNWGYKHLTSHPFAADFGKSVSE